jgi:hypothetical protein
MKGINKDKHTHMYIDITKLKKYGFLVLRKINKKLTEALPHKIIVASVRINRLKTLTFQSRGTFFINEHINFITNARNLHSSNFLLFIL